MKYILVITSFFLLEQNLSGQKPVSQDSISVFFDELKTAAHANTELWNKDLYGPTILIDPESRTFFANEQDQEGSLQPNGGIYSGILPGKINIANTAIDWNGKKWAMIMLPLTHNKHNRINLLAHESFHRIQPSLGFTFKNTDNNHLDQKEGRIYLRLELEALKKAIQPGSEKEKQQHLTNAFIFRKYRHQLYENSGVSENQLELNEGLAEFTGVIISNRNKAETSAFFQSEINEFFKNPTFVRSFAYYTIPVYGYLLYDKDKNWNKTISVNIDLTDYFIKALKISIPKDLKKSVQAVSANYNGKNILKEETEREERTKKLIAEYKLKLITQPHFEIKFEKMNISFDPRNIIPVEDKGTVYPNLRVTDRWGILTVDKGAALMSPNWDKISISNPVKTDDKNISGDGWILELTDGYTIGKDETTGNYKLIKKPN